MRRYPVSPALIGIVGFMLLYDTWHANQMDRFVVLGIGLAHQGYLFWKTDKDLDA